MVVETGAHPLEIINVIHVDDEQDQLQFTRLFLQDADQAIRVTSVTSHVEALTKLEEGGVDCIVMDYSMPDINGIEFASLVRENYDTPLIIYTGRGSEEVAEAAFEVGVDDYVRKELEPRHYQLLARRIRATVEKYRSEKIHLKAEKRYRELFEAVADGLFQTEL